MIRFDLRLSIRYAFDRPIGPARQILRILPAQVPGVQRLLGWNVSVRPAPAEDGWFTDFFGTRALALSLPGGLTDCELVLTAQVERARHAARRDTSARLAGLAAQIAAEAHVGPGAPHHFLPPSPRIAAIPAVTDFARSATAGSQTVHEATAALGRALHRRMAFDAQATDVDTPPARAFAQRRGVCQDFAQIMVAGLRGLGVPAAYVSGYLRTRPPPGQPRLAGADAMHAWVRVWMGADAGWIDHDPTNDVFVGGDHIEIGFGRDYGDVAPVIGMLRTEGGRAGGGQSGSHAVDLVEAPPGADADAGTRPAPDAAPA